MLQLPYQEPFNLTSWLQQLPPYNDGVRDEVYWQHLFAPINRDLHQALLSQLKRYDGADSLDYLEQCYRNYNEARAHFDQPGVLYRIRERDDCYLAVKQAVLGNPEMVNMAMMHAKYFLVANLADHLGAVDTLESVRADPFVDALYTADKITDLNKVEINRILTEFTQRDEVTMATRRLSQYFNDIMHELSTHGAFENEPENLAQLRQALFDAMFAEQDAVRVRNAFIDIVKKKPYNWTLMEDQNIDQVQVILTHALETAAPSASTDVQNLWTLTDELLEELIEEHPRVNEFYGQECHQLWNSYGIYRIDGQHKLDKNMVWVLGHIHGRRQIMLRSDLRMTNFMRQTGGRTNEPSAFSNEISALMRAHYTLQRQEDGRFVLNCPPIQQALSLSDIQHDMSNVYHRIKVLDGVSQLLEQKEVLLTNERQVAFAQLKERYHRAQDAGPIDLGTIRQRIAASQQALRQAYQSYDINTLDGIRDRLMQFQHRTVDQTRHLQRIEQIQQDRARCDQIQSLDQGIPDVQALKKVIQVQANTLLESHNQNKDDNLSAFRTRLQQVVDSFGQYVNPQPGQHPPDLAMLAENVGTLWKDIDGVFDLINQQGLIHLNYTVVTDLKTEVNKLSSQIATRQMQDTQQELQQSQAERLEDSSPDEQPGVTLGRGKT